MKLDCASTAVYQDARMPRRWSQNSTVEMPANVFVRCPATGWKNIQARRCESCQWFHGLHQHAESTGAQRFVDRYRVKCGFPIDRAMLEIEMG